VGDEVLVVERSADFGADRSTRELRGNLTRTGQRRNHLRLPGRRARAPAALKEEPVSILRSPLPDVEIPEMSLTELLFGGDLPDRPALVDPAERRVTFPELRAWTERIAGGLHAAGIGTGDVVGLFAPNSPEWVATFQGILRANANCVSFLR
jgi:non-ribosomal peptide synthetase component F